MSLRSMTGHGSGVASSGGMRVEVEVSSVNRKQLDVTIHLPSALALIESRVQEKVAESVSRGRVIVDVAVRESGRLKRKAIRIDAELARAYVDELRASASRLKLRNDLSLSHLLALPGVLHYEPIEDDLEKAWPLVSGALRRALEGLLRMRTREGAALRKDLEARLREMKGMLRDIRKMSPRAMARYREALEKRLADLIGRADMPRDRIERELVLYADKSDVAEEATRLDSHIGQALKILRSGGTVGRSLDFLAQEMFREINTTGSKSNDADISQRVVAFKAELERFREQVQNIE
jgi:uncharacterized protein (TIGR00255 family)